MRNKQDRKSDALCIAFQNLATRTWYRMKNNHETPISIREDGITALNLQDLYHLQSQEFTVVDFSPHVESNITGADWEWWIMQPGNNFGMAVQAKSLSKKGTYDIPYVPQNGYPQIQRLLDYSLSNGLMPLYCFYNWWRFPPAHFWPCGSYVEKEDLWGCALADGLTIWKLHCQKKYTIQSIHTCTMPWHCIVCCSGHVGQKPVGPGTKAEGIAQVLRGHSRKVSPDNMNIKEDEYTNFPEPTFHEEIPKRISVLRRLVKAGEEIDAGVIREYFGKYPPKKVVLQGSPDQKLEETEQRH